MLSTILAALVAFLSALGVSTSTTATSTMPASVPSAVQISATSVPATSPTPPLALGIYGYYPKASASSYYLLPGQVMSFSGSGFAPGEVITLMGPGGTIATWSAGQNGAFSGAGAYTVPFSLEHSTQNFSVTGSVSGKTIPMQVVVGTFYPNVTPSSYYVAPEQAMSASALGFAPGEPVELLVNGNIVATQTADQSGTTLFNFSAPGGSTFTVTAQGAWSGASSQRTVTLMQ